MIRIENISKKYADQKVLDHITYHFPQGERIALVGANGQGKTTLLNAITGVEAPDDGRVIKPKDHKLSFLAQSFSDHPQATILLECVSGHEAIFRYKVQMEQSLKEMETEYSDEVYEAYEKHLRLYEAEGGYQIEGLAERVLQGLGFRPDQLSESPLKLSGGWRMRLELAKILVSNPDFIILDEPTNHLDLPSIEWLENYLLDFKGTLLFVSHDRTFLNALGTVTLHLQSGQVREYQGNFDSFLRQRELLQSGQEAAAKKLEQQKAHMQKFVDRFRAKASKASQAQSRMKQIEKIDAALENSSVLENDKAFHIPKLNYPKSGKEVLVAENLTVGYKDPLIKDVHLRMLRGEKIGIIGANGKGKTTLLKTLMEAITPLKGSVQLGTNVHTEFYSQGAAEDIRSDQSVFNCIAQQNPDLTGQEQRALLGAFLFKGNDLKKKTKVLSGGERARLVFACLFGRLPNLILMDEPTNHLDMMSKDILAEMLRQYTGSLLFVSHDRDFIESVADDILEVVDQKLQRLI